MRNFIAILFFTTLSLFIDLSSVITPVSAQEIDPTYCTNENVSSTFDPRKCCGVKIEQYDGDIHTNVGMPDRIFKPSAGTDDDVYRIHFNMSNIPSSFWTSFMSDGDSDTLPDELQSSWVTYDLDLNDPGVENPLFSKCRDDIGDIGGTPSTISIDVLFSGSKFVGGGCLYDSLETDTKPFTLALRYENESGENVSICELPVTVYEKTYEQAKEEGQTATALITSRSHNGQKDTKSKWTIAVENVFVPPSWLNYSSQLQFIFSFESLPDEFNSFQNIGENLHYDSSLEGDRVNERYLNPLMILGASNISSFISQTKDKSVDVVQLKPLAVGDYYVTLVYYSGFWGTKVDETRIEVVLPGDPTPIPEPTPTPTPSFLTCEQAISQNSGELTEELCDSVCYGVEEYRAQCDSFNTIQIKKICENLKGRGVAVSGSGDEYEQCKRCLGKGNAYTAFGCLPTSVEGFFKTVLFQLGLGLAGGVAFLLMLWGSFTMLISQGDPQQIQRGREIIVSAIAGLLLIIFSMVIMQFLGYNVLQIPGFNPSEGAPSDEVGSSGETGPSEPTPTPTPTPIPEELIVLPDSDFSNADIVFSPTTQNPDENISGTMTFTSQNPRSSYHTLALLVTDVSRTSENDKILQCREAPPNNLSEHDLASLAIQLPPSDSPDINNLLLNVYFSKWTCADIVSNNITNVRTLSFQQNTTLQGYKRIIINN